MRAQTPQKKSLQCPHAWTSRSLSDPNDRESCARRGKPEWADRTASLTAGCGLLLTA